MRFIKVAVWLYLSLTLISTCFCQDIPFRSFGLGDWSKLTSSSGQKPIVIHFWGVTCGPCMAEMPKWGAFVAKNKDLHIVFIQVDEVTKAKMSRFIIRSHLEAAENYTLTEPFDEIIRYEVDPKWQGETPVTFLISKSSNKRLSGPVNFDTIKSWYQKNL
jgi:thiol-disulfide isomerase/thioredoxin